MHMPDLLLDESIGVPELQKVCDIGVPEAVQRQVLRQAGFITQLCEPPIEIPSRQTRAALGHPERVEVVSGRETGPGLLEPLLHAGDPPVEFRHQQHRALWCKSTVSSITASVRRRPNA